MEWHWPDLHALLHHLPQRLADLQRHEDTALVTAGMHDFTARAPAEGQIHRLLLPQDASGIGLGKEMDPAVSRSQQNMGLLVQDYLHSLPVYAPRSREAEALLEHWRRLLLEQPERLAQAKTSFWGTPQAKAFWQERVRRIRPDHVLYMDDDWERAAAVPAPHPAAPGAWQETQWRDLVIRNRLHHLQQYLIHH